MSTNRSDIPPSCMLYSSSGSSKTSIRASNTLDKAMDTVHYLSPASLSTPTQISICEGDFVKTPDYDYLRSQVFPSGELSKLLSSETSSIPCTEPTVQRTVAIIKPDAMIYQDVIERAIIFKGFTILMKRLIHYSPEQVSEIFSQLYGSPSFPYLVVSMSVAPVLTLVIASVNAVAKWKDIVGPEKALKAEWFYPLSMRIKYGKQEEMINAVHASQNYQEALKENRYVNPDSIIEPIISEEHLVTDYCDMYINPTLLQGLVELVRVKPIDPILYLGEWLLRNNPYQPQLPETLALLPT